MKTDSMLYGARDWFDLQYQTRIVEQICNFSLSSCVTFISASYQFVRPSIRTRKTETRGDDDDPTKQPSK